MDLTHRVVTVAAPNHVVEVLVPEDMTAAQLIPELLAAVADEQAPATNAAGSEPLRTSTVWSLVRRPGFVLSPDEPLNARDGDEFALVGSAEAIRPPKVLPALVAPAPDRQAVRWSASNTRTAGWIGMLAGLAATLVVIGWMYRAEARSTLPFAGGAAAGWTTFLAVVSRRWPSSTLTSLHSWIRVAAHTLVAGLWVEAVWTVPATVLTGGNLAGFHIAGTAGAVGLMSVLLGWSCRDPLIRGISVASFTAAVSVGVPATIAACWANTSVSAAAAVTAVLASVIVRESAPLAVRLRTVFLAHPTRGHPKRGVEASTAGESAKPPGPVDREHAAESAMTAVLVGGVLAWLYAWPPLIGGTPAEHALLAATAVIAVSRPRTTRYRDHRAATLLAAAAAMTALGCVYLMHEPEWVAFAVACVVAVSSPLVATRVAGHAAPVTISRLTDMFEATAVAALVPLLADDLGLFRAASSLARGWVG